MKQLLTYSTSALLLAAMLIGLCRFTAIQVNYWANKAEIIELFCINKDKPEMHCDGKCHLKESFEDLDSGDNESSGTENLKEFRFSPVVFFGSLNTEVGIHLDRHYQPEKIETEKSGFPISIDRPPGNLTL